MKTFRLEILTPFGEYLTINVDYLRVQSSRYRLGILPEHAPLVSSLIASEIAFKSGSKEEIFATSGGIIKVDKEKVTLLLDSIERVDEIDYSRAKDAQNRAESRLKNSKDEEEIKQAQRALERAKNRIAIYERNRRE